MFALAFAILFVSIFDSSVITYPNPDAKIASPEDCNIPSINYYLPSTGRVLPDSPLWKIKALRDRVWFGITPSHLRKAQLALLFADKRLVMAQTLYKRGEAEIALVTLTKAEKYLPIALQEETIARQQGTDTNTFLMQLSLASLKHKEIIEEMMQLVPDSDKAIVVQNERYADDVYDAVSDVLNSKGFPLLKNPFDGE